MHAHAHTHTQDISPFHLATQNLQLKREVVFLKEGEPSNPVWISEIVVMGHGIVHGDFLMIV